MLSGVSRVCGSFVEDVMGKRNESSTISRLLVYLEMQAFIEEMRPLSYLIGEMVFQMGRVFATGDVLL